MTKKQSVNVPDKVYKHKPKFSISALKEFSELFAWLKEISRFNRVEDFVYISDYKKGKIRIKIFTKDHQYNISASLPEVENDGCPLKKGQQKKVVSSGYLGCIAETRKPRAGEDWERRNDLADGGYGEETWREIKNDILAYELVKVVRSSPDKETGRAIEAVVDDKKKWLIEMLENNLSTLKNNDEMGFIWRGKHFVIKQGEFSN